MNIQFGSGVVFGKPVYGDLPTNPTPFKFGVLQETTVDFKADLKKLYGQYQYPVATARGKFDSTFKGKLAVYDPNMLNQLYFSQPSSSGYALIVDSEAHTVNVNTVTVTNAGEFLTDWGIQDALTQQQFTEVPNVAALTTTSLYVVNVSTGVYTFNNGDANRAIKISYTYNVSAGTTITLANQLMGYAPEIALLLYNKFRNKYLAVQLNDVVLGSFSIPSKLEDFWVTDIDGAAVADPSNNLGLLMMDNF